MTAAKFSYVYTSAGNKTGLSIIERVVCRQGPNACENVPPISPIDKTSPQTVLWAFLAAVCYFILSAVVISVCL